MKSKIVLFFTIIVCFLMQSTVLHLISIGSITPNLLLILCVSMGLMRGRKSGLWTGFFCGLLVDLFYGSVFGFYALIYMYAGFLSGYAFRIYYDDDIKVPMLLTAIMDFLYNLAVYALQFLLRGRLGLGVYFTRIIVPEIFYTVFLTMIVYRVFHYVNYHFMSPTRMHLISIGSITPNLLLILCVSMGLMRGRKSGLWTGFFCGLLVDLFYGSVFGFYALIYMYAGFLSGYAFRIYYDDDIKVPMLLTAIMDFLYNLAVYALQFLLRGRLGLGVYFTRIIVPEIFYTVFLTMIVYRVFHYINYHFMSPTRKESESIWVLK